MVWARFGHGLVRAEVMMNSKQQQNFSATNSSTMIETNDEQQDESN